VGGWGWEGWGGGGIWVGVVDAGGSRHAQGSRWQRAGA
jgi:hypothetical protein